jgi:hypothetical protein
MALLHYVVCLLNYFFSNVCKKGFIFSCCMWLLHFAFAFIYSLSSKCCKLLHQNFLFTSKDENSQLKAIDFGLSDYVKPGSSSML